MQYIKINESATTCAQIKSEAKNIKTSCTLYFNFNNPSAMQILAATETLPRGASFALHPETPLELFILAAQNLKPGCFFRIHSKTPDSVLSETINNASTGVIVAFNNTKHRLFDTRPRHTLESRDDFLKKLAFLDRMVMPDNASHRLK